MDELEWHQLGQQLKLGVVNDSPAFTKYSPPKHTKSSNTWLGLVVRIRAQVWVWGPLGNITLRYKSRPRGNVVDLQKALEYNLFDVRNALVTK